MEEYILVRWPDIQSMMDQDWFNTECFLCQGCNTPESAYFVPKDRYLVFFGINY